jgi:hypothetical protein
MKPLPDAQSRFASLQSGEADIVWDDEADADNIIKARKDTSLTVHTYEGSGAAVAAFNTKVPPFDDVRVRQALVMALDRNKMSQAITNGLARPASNPYGDGSWVKCKDDGALPYDVEKAKALLKDYGKPVEFKMLVTEEQHETLFLPGVGDVEHSVEHLRHALHLHARDRVVGVLEGPEPFTLKYNFEPLSDDETIPPISTKRTTTFLFKSLNKENPLKYAV